MYLYNICLDAVSDSAFVCDSRIGSNIVHDIEINPLCEHVCLFVNLRNNVVEVYSNPTGGKYNAERIAGKGETLQLPGGFQGVVSVDEIIVKL